MPPSPSSFSDIQTKIWSGSIPLEIRLAASDCRTYEVSDPYLAQPPRLTYLAFLLPRLHTFFAPFLIDPNVEVNEAWLSLEGVPLKWHYPLGLLYDLFSGAEPANGKPPGKGQDQSQPAPVEAPADVGPIPWRLILHFTDYPGEQLISLDLGGRALHDAYINSVKEADFLRNGSAKTVMSLSKEDSDNLWLSVRNHDLKLFNTINNKLLNPPGVELRHVPIKFYLPSMSCADPATQTETTEKDPSEERTRAGHIEVVQAPVPLNQISRQPHTLGTALNGVIPSIFPSRRNPILAQPVLHGAIVPMSAVLGDLGRAASYADGFLHVAVVMLG